MCDCVSFDDAGDCVQSVRNSVHMRDYVCVSAKNGVEVSMSMRNNVRVCFNDLCDCVCEC